jgi:hypothetical protein
VPRRSSSSLSVVPVIPGSGRPPPPRGLDQVERRLWKGVVAALPAHWVDQAGAQVLRRAVSLMAILERWEVQLREYRARGTAGDAEAIKLAASHGATARIVSQLLGTLRATPQSRAVSRAARSKIEEAPKVRPWEIKAHGDSA